MEGEDGGGKVEGPTHVKAEGAGTARDAEDGEEGREHEKGEEGEEDIHHIRGEDHEIRRSRGGDAKRVDEEEKVAVECPSE